MTKASFRSFIPSPAQSKIAGPTARAHAEARLKSPRAHTIVRNPHGNDYGLDLLRLHYAREHWGQGTA